MAAERYEYLGFYWLPLRPGEKSELKDAEKYRTHQPQLAVVGDVLKNDSNIGLRLGLASGDLIDVDADSSEVRTVLRFRRPNHPSVSGRKSSPNAHYWFRDPNLTENFHRKYRDPVAGEDEKAMILEVRADSACQTMVPPSKHPNGEDLFWLNNEDNLDDPRIKIVTRDLIPEWDEAAAAGLLARYAHGSDDFNHTTLVLTSWLARAEWERERIITFVASFRNTCGAKSLTGNRDDRHRIEQLVDDPLKRRSEDKRLYGFSEMVKCFDHGEIIVKTASEWLGMSDRVLNLSYPRLWVDELTAEFWEVDGVRTIGWSEGDFRKYEKGAYRIIHNDETIKSEIAEGLSKYKIATKDGPRPFPVDSKKKNEALGALRDKTNLDRYNIQPPAWLGDSGGYDPEKIIAFRNGLLYLPTGEFLPPTPKLYTLTALDTDYDPNAPEPTKWFKFLNDLFGEGKDRQGNYWEGDEDSKQVLQEWFGLNMVSDTSYQKMLLMTGPPRCGKGTIANVMRAVVGPENTDNPTVSSLSSHFGMESLIGKTSAVMTDVRVGHKIDNPALTERLLTISGEDSISIPRKNKLDHNAQL